MECSASRSRVAAGEGTFWLLLSLLSASPCSPRRVALPAVDCALEEDAALLMLALKCVQRRRGWEISRLLRCDVAAAVTAASEARRGVMTGK